MEKLHIFGQKSAYDLIEWPESIVNIYSNVPQSIAAIAASLSKTIVTYLSPSFIRWHVSLHLESSRLLKQSCIWIDYLEGTSAGQRGTNIITKKDILLTCGTEL